MNIPFWRSAGRAAVWWLVVLPCHAQAGARNSAPSVAPASSPVLLPGEAVAAAVRIHPSVLAARIDLDHARGEAAEVRLFVHNPQVSAGASVDGRRASGSASQPLSLAGEGSAARRAAEARVEVARLQLQRAHLEAAASCRRAYVEAIVRSRQVAIAVEGRGLAMLLRDAVARQLDVGEASTLDLRLAELALVQASARLLEARRVEAEALRTLSALAGQPVDGSALVSDPRDVVPADSTAESPPGERSDLRARQAGVQHATAHRALQRASALAPVGVGVSLSVEDGQRFVGPTLQATLPLFDRNQAGRFAADAELDLARSAERSLLARVQSEQDTARLRVAEAQDLEAGGLDNTLAEARAALASIDSGYRAGQIDLPSAIFLQKEVLAGESAALALLGGIALARVDLLLAHDDPRLISHDAAPSRGGAP